MSTDRIEKQIFLRAPRKRVWRAISDSKEFGNWFGVKFDDWSSGDLEMRAATRRDFPAVGRCSRPPAQARRGLTQLR